MTELERLLVGSARWLDGHEDADLVGLAALGDWLDEHARDADAAHVRAIVRAERVPIVPLFDGGVGQSITTLTDYRSGRKLRSLRAYCQQSLTITRPWLRVTLLEWPVGGRGKVTVWGSDKRLVRSKVRIEVPAQAEAYFERLFRVARWHAICHLLGYVPYRLLAACAGAL